MASIYDKASLVLIPSGTKTSKVYSQKPTNGDGDFTFSRSTAATRVNASGNIEKETNNYLLQSNSFSTGSWNKGNATITTGQSGYDGSNDATLLSATGTFSRIFQDISSFNGVFTASAYIKAGTASWINFRMQGTYNNQIYFDIVNGVLGSVFAVDLIDTSIDNVGNGWYRVAVTLNMSSVSQFNIYIADADGSLSTTNETIYIQDFQAEQGLVARDYIETTTTAIYGGITDNVPRLDYTDSSCPALLLEPQRTNELGNSEYGFSNTNSIITYNDTTSPEGLQNAFKLTENTASGNHRADTNFNADADTYTFSVFAKAGERNNINFAASNVGAFSSTFNLTTGVLEGITGATGSIQDYGNGWYRLIVTKTISSAGGVAIRIGTATNSATQAAGNTQNYTGDGVSGLYLYGYMVERGSYATSYIPTYGSAVTRNADDCNATSITDIVGQTEGTLYAEVDVTSFKQGVTSEIILSAYSNTANRIMMSLDGIGTKGVYIFIRSFSSSYDLYTPKSFSLGTNKLAFSYGENYRAVYLNGEKINESTSTFVVPPIPNLAIGRRDDNSGQFADGIKQTLIFNTRLTDQEAIDLTTI